ncbi:M23 family metallopeptidase [candidate division KSB1 bacterium]
MVDKEFKLLYINQAVSKSKEYNLTRIKLYFFGSIIFLLFICISGVSVKYISNLIYSYKITNLEKEKSQIKQRLTELKGVSALFEKNLNDLILKDDDVRIFAGIKKLDKSYREVGVGGGSVLKLELSPFYDKEENDFNEVFEDFERYSRIISIQRDSYENTFNRWLENKERLRFTPTYRPVIGGKITTIWGYRVHPVTQKKGDFHHGIDIARLKVGTPVFAAADGTVIISKFHNILGNYIQIDHNSKKHGYQTRYGHLKRMFVKKGDAVKRGDIIGEVGDTGRMTAPHLHFEVHEKGKRIDPLRGYFNPNLSY